jgi:hypothetical protein
LNTLFTRLLLCCAPVSYRDTAARLFHPPSILTYLLSPRCRVLLEQLTGLHLVKKFPAFHGTPRFITALTSVRPLSLSWASPIQSIYPHSTSWRSILILSIHLRLGLLSGSFPPVSPSILLSFISQPAKRRARSLSYGQPHANGWRHSQDFTFQFTRSS